MAAPNNSEVPVIMVKDDAPSKTASARQQYKDTFLKKFVQLLDRSTAGPSLQGTKRMREPQFPLFFDPAPQRPQLSSSSGGQPMGDSVLTTPPSKKLSHLNECSHGEDPSSSSKLSPEDQVIHMEMRESAISEGWRLNGGAATVDSPEERAIQNSMTTFEGEEAHRKFDASLMDTMAGLDESDIARLSKTWKDGKFLAERLRKHRRESAAELASDS